MARVNWNRAVEVELGYGNAVKIVGPAADKTVTLAKGRARSKLPEGTGQLSEFIEPEKDFRFPKASARIGVLKLAIHKGAAWRYTGTLKPKRPTVADVLVLQEKGHGPIFPRTPRKASATLLFKYNGKWRAVRGTSGFPSNPILSKSFKESVPAWVPVTDLPF